MTDMDEYRYSGYAEELYKYEELPTETSYRVMELLPGKDEDPISCLLHVADWDSPLEYEAISYAWGENKETAPVNVHGKRVEVTMNLHAGLEHLRYQDQSRFLWADALCTNQRNISERGCQVAQMRRIYENAKTVLIWLGPDAHEQPRAKMAIDGILQLSDFVCQRLGISIEDVHEYGEIYLQVILKNRDKLPLPDECKFATESMWQSLIWFYSHRYFTRVWVIQEINSNRERLLHCGKQSIIWDHVHLVAGYLMMETVWVKSHGFSSTYIWWVSTMSTELVSNPRNWIHVLYLASMFSATDSRDLIFGLRGIMSPHKAAEFLRPNYSKSRVEVYRDSVKAALLDFQNTNVLCYLHGHENPSWIPEWDKEMVFRNPFRFGKEMPWSPSGDTKAVWNINHELNVLSLAGFIVDSIKAVEPYNQSYFGKAMAESENGRDQLKKAWQRIMTTWGNTQSQVPFGRDIITAAATSLSFGLDESCEPAEYSYFLVNFVAYLNAVLDEETYSKYIPPELTDEAKNAKAEAFGKPVWDFVYPESSFFITEHNFIGCSISRNEVGDKVWIPLGSTYPLILRPVENQFRLKGFSYVHGVMHGELLQDSKPQFVEIR